MNEKWDRRFLELAKHISTWSKDPSTKCGAVVVRPNKTIASVGYNGFPRGLDDDERLNNRQEKLSLTIHAEMNAILVAEEPLNGYTLYTYPLLPCDRCAVHVIQAGILSVLSYHIPETLKEKWGESVNKSREYFNEAWVNVVLYRREKENRND